MPHVADYYFTAHLAELDPPAIAYTRDDDPEAALRFAAADCTLYPHVIAGGWPVDATPEGFVVWSGSTLSLFNPLSGADKTLNEQTAGLALRRFAGHHLVFGAGQIVVFTPDWRRLGAFGENVVRAERAGSSLFFEDDTGIHRLALANGGVTNTVVAADGCELASREEPWILYFAPCAERKLVVYHEPSAQSAALDIAARPRDVKLKPAVGSPGTNPSTQPFWFFYLRDVNPETNLGTLIVRGPDGAEEEVGPDALLDLSAVIETPEGTHGYGLVSFAGETGTYRYWAPGGITRDLATRTLRDAGRLIIDYDGVAGNLAATAGDQLHVIAERVPYRGYEYRDRKDRWTAIYRDFDGTHGSLAILDGGLDGAQSAFENSRSPAFELRTIASDVGYFRTAFLDFVLPGIVYLAEHDPERGIGLLEYRNLELGFTAQIASGVADFIVTADDVLYTVPYGDAAGIWLLQAK
jgi:hypothetical protein